MQDSSKPRSAKKRRLWPVLSVALIVCYLGVFLWYFLYGFGDTREPDDTPEVTESVLLPQAPSRAPTPEVTVQEVPAEPAKDFPPAVAVRGLYVTAWYAGIDEKMDGYIEICDTTEINALVIDVKDDMGQITFITDTESISETGVYIIPDIEWIVATLKNHGVYTIARIVCFKDPVWSRLHPELAIHNTSGDRWQDGSGNSWLDPYNEGSWEYIADVCLEAARVGFDEVQLDYVRFPSDGSIRSIDYGEAGAEKSKTEIIGEFVTYIREILAHEGVRLAADVFGIIAISEVDAESIGQDMGLLLSSADYLCPMIYPSHFANKRQNGTGQIINDILFEAPDLEPYGVVYNILLGVHAHLDSGSGNAVIRPYLQDFTAAYLTEGLYQDYTAQQVREQIEAVYEAGFDEWIIWNHNGVYSEGAFDLLNADDASVPLAEAVDP